MDMAVKFKVNRYHKVWIIRAYVYLRSTFTKCSWKKTPNNRFSSATSVPLYSSLSDRLTRWDHTLDGIHPAPGLLLLELALSQFPHTQVSSVAALGTLRTQMMVKLQTLWGQDPFTDSRHVKAVLLKPHADSRKESEPGCNTPEIGKLRQTKSLRAVDYPSLRNMYPRAAQVSLRAWQRDSASQCCCFVRSSSRPQGHSPGASPHRPAWILLRFLWWKSAL